MCDAQTHGRHVTSINGAMRCVLCGHRLVSRRFRLRDVPGELLDRHRAREALWRQPTVICGVLHYRYKVGGGRHE